MPELPEVETVSRELREGHARRGPSVVGAKIVAVRVGWPRSIGAPSPRAFPAQAAGRTIVGVSRRGKYIVFQLDRGALLVHLKMSGDLTVVPRAAPADRHAHTVFELSNGHELRFSDTRKFGRVYLVGDPGDVTGELGPEPLSPEFTAQELARQLKGRRRLLKPLLLDQTFIAGLGNIYADEALHRARLHPLRRGDSLSPAEAKRLWRGIRDALQSGIRHNGASLDWVYRGGSFQNHFRAYQRTGEPCPRCGTPIRRIQVGQRSTHFCPECQSLENW